MIELIDKELKQLREKVIRLENRRRRVFPIYDLPDHPPVSAVEGELALSIDRTLWEYINGEWHKATQGDITYNAYVNPSIPTHAEIKYTDFTLAIGYTNQVVSIPAASSSFDYFYGYATSTIGGSGFSGGIVANVLELPIFDPGVYRITTKCEFTNITTASSTSTMNASLSCNVGIGTHGDIRESSSFLSSLPHPIIASGETVDLSFSGLWKTPIIPGFTGYYVSPFLSMGPGFDIEHTGSEDFTFTVSNIIVTAVKISDIL